MINKIFSLLKNKEFMLYVVFGILTFIVNIFSVVFFFDFLHVEIMISNGIAVILSILFAYITNKIWVFESKNKKIHIELTFFMSGRVFTGIVDMGLFFFLHSLYSYFVAKVISQIVVIVLNYVISKIVVFK
ncbi:MAG: GtrA family protein [Methanobrevibacter sp.]|jgi:putative flippase GtrA|nr:GtrA family protein [Candidatus Methanovirga procula]